MQTQTQTPDPGLESGGSQPGTLPPGTIALAPDYANPRTLYALNSDGIFSSTDGGATWSLCARGARSMRMVSPPPGQSGRAVLYVSLPQGLRASDDSCRTWRDVPAQGILPSGAGVRWLAPYPDNPLVLYAGMDGLGGLYRSTDGGQSWQGASGNLPPGAWVTALTAHPDHPEQVLVGLRYATNDHPPAYIYRSTDGGLNWRSSSLGIRMLPNNGGRIVGFAWSGRTLFAATASDGLYRSTDGGQSWQATTMPRRTLMPPRAALPGAPPATPLPLAISAFSGTWEGALLIGTPEGAFQSLDGGNSWQSFGPEALRGRPTMLALDPNTGRALVAGEGRVWAYTMQSGLVRLLAPTVPAGAAAQLPPTPTPTPAPPPSPPPPPPTNTPTPAPATPTPLPQPTPTPAIAQGPLPTDRAQPLDPSIADYFQETGHNIKYGFRGFWHNNGGLARFGYPLTEEFVENGVTVQYFERARFEYRDGKITLGRIGAELIEGLFFRQVPFFVSTDTNVYFGPTRHSVSGPFLEYWRQLGGLEGLGYPLSESFKEQGSEYQWFERGRLEWHPWLPQGQRIVPGNVGTELLKKKGWLR